MWGKGVPALPLPWGISGGVLVNLRWFIGWLPPVLLDGYLVGAGLGLDLGAKRAKLEVRAASIGLGGGCKPGPKGIVWTQLRQAQTASGLHF